MGGALLLCLLYLDALTTAKDGQVLQQRLIVVVLDGLRWDSIEKANMNNLQRLHETGAHAGYMMNAFPTLTFPATYTIFTGLYTESHGMSADFMFNAYTKEYFLRGQNHGYNQGHWWDGAEPLWITTVRQGKRASVYFLPGCDVPIRGLRPTHWEAYKPGTTLDDFQWALGAASFDLTVGGQSDLAIVYYGEPDHSGHLYGPESSEYREAAEAIDREIGLLLAKLDVLQTLYPVNVMIVSDHGLTDISPERTINVTQLLAHPDLVVTIMGASSMLNIYTASWRRTIEVYNLLKDFHENMTVYLKNDVPERFYYKHGRYVGDILCVARLGWSISQPLYPYFPNKDGTPYRGQHGYDNKEPDMRGIFYASGRYFQPASEVIYLESVDPYNVMCDLLGIEAAPNNGSRFRTLSLVSRSAGHCVTPVRLFATVASSLITLVALIIM